MANILPDAKPAPSNLQPGPRWPSWGLALACVLCVAGGYALTQWDMREVMSAGEPLPAGFVETQNAVLDWLTVAPRPAGSGALMEVQEKAKRFLEDLGYTVYEIRGTASNDFNNVAKTRNFLAIPPSLAPGTTVKTAFVAHLDSSPVSKGANDAGLAVASILAAATTLCESESGCSESAILFTDAEEFGLLGAYRVRALMDLGEDPEAPCDGCNEDVMRQLNAIRAFFNVEGRGGRGPVLFFEWGDLRNRDMNKLLADVPGIWGHSLLMRGYKLMPNDTDLTALSGGRTWRVSGLNFAHIGDGHVYHSTFDNRDSIDAATQAHQGRLVLDLMQTHARSFRGYGGPVFQADAAMLLRVPGFDSVVPFYGSFFAPVGLIVALALWFLVARIYRWKRLKEELSVILRTGLSVVVLILIGLAVFGLVMLILPSYQSSPFGGPYQRLDALFLLSMAGGALLFAAVQSSRRTFWHSDRLSLLALGGIVVASIFLIGTASYLTFLLILAVVVRWAWDRASRTDVGGPALRLVLWLAALLSLSLAVWVMWPAFTLIPDVAGPVVPALGLLIGALFGPYLTPVAQRVLKSRRARWLTVVASSALMLIGVVFVAGSTAQLPAPTRHIMLVDLPDGSRHWVSGSPRAFRQVEPAAEPFDLPELGNRLDLVPLAAVETKVQTPMPKVRQESAPGRLTLAADPEAAAVQFWIVTARDSEIQLAVGQDFSATLGKDETTWLIGFGDEPIQMTAEQEARLDFVAISHGLGETDPPAGVSPGWLHWIGETRATVGTGSISRP